MSALAPPLALVVASAIFLGLSDRDAERNNLRVAEHAIDMSATTLDGAACAGVDATALSTALNHALDALDKGGHDMVDATSTLLDVRNQVANTLPYPAPTVCATASP